MYRRTASVLACVLSMLSLAPASSLAGGDDVAGVSVAQWTGPYVGVAAGYAWGEADHSYSNTAPSGGSDPAGGLVGAFGGYNFQSGALVLGIEGDIETTNADGSFSDAAGITSIGTSEIDWQGSLRGRLGLAVGAQSLVYLTAGWAFADVDLGGGPLPGPACCGYSETMHGWTVGGGLEQALTKNLIVRLEYRYSDFGEAEGQLGPVFPTVAMPVDLTTHAVRLGAAWKW